LIWRKSGIAVPSEYGDAGYSMAKKVVGTCRNVCKKITWKKNCMKKYYEII
jgi:hypothetical protein